MLLPYARCRLSAMITPNRREKMTRSTLTCLLRAAARRYRALWIEMRLAFPISLLAIGLASLLGAGAASAGTLVEFPNL